jgi:hypothetical protein
MLKPRSECDRVAFSRGSVSQAVKNYVREADPYRSPKRYPKKANSRRNAKRLFYLDNFVHDYFTIALRHLWAL